MTNTKQKDWENEFEDKLAPIFYVKNVDGTACTINKNIVKDFIQNLLTQQKKEIVEMIKEKGLHLGYKNNIIELLTKE